MTETVSIQCGERLSIERVEALHEEMEEAIRAGKDIHLQAEKVEFCDTAGMQLLVSLKQQMDSSGHRMIWDQVSPCLFQISGLLGLDEHLALPEVNEGLATE